MQRFYVRATHIEHPRDLYRVAEAALEDVYVEKDGRRVRSGSILGLMSLNICPGDSVCLIAPDVGARPVRELGNLIGRAEEPAGSAAPRGRP